MEWQPIETAPMDGTRILLVIDHGNADNIWTGLWANGWFVSYGKVQTVPTHWMPLPEAPSEVKYGCHCDLEENMKPDSCVLDENKSDDCIFAKGLISRGLGKESCDEWRPIVVNGK